MNTQTDNVVPLTGRRPRLITILCILSFISMSLAIAGILTPSVRGLLTKQYGSFFIPISIFITVLGFVALLGLWKMRKWGIYTYTAMTILSVGSGLIFGISGLSSYILPVIIVIFGFANLEKMN